MNISEAELAAMTPREFRHMVRRNEWTEGSFLACRGYAQANVIILPKDYAYEFLLFCNRNPRPCPIIDVTEIGNPHPPLSPEADLRTDSRKYKVWKDGELVDEPTDIIGYWRDDLVGFLLGCSSSFHWLFKAANIRFRFLGAFITNIQCIPAGRFRGPLVVTCCLFKSGYDAVRATQITSRLIAVHGPPIHIGDPATIGIKDLCHADFGAPPDVIPPQPGEVALYWGCGQTPEVIIREIKPSLAITPQDLDLLIIDPLTEELANL